MDIESFAASSGPLLCSNMISNRKLQAQHRHVGRNALTFCDPGNVARFVEANGGDWHLGEPNTTRPLLVLLEFTINSWQDLLCVFNHLPSSPVAKHCESASHAEQSADCAFSRHSASGVWNGFGGESAKYPAHTMPYGADWRNGKTRSRTMSFIIATRDSELPEVLKIVDVIARRRQIALGRCSLANCSNDQNLLPKLMNCSSQ